MDFGINFISIIISLSASLLGVFILLRRLALVSDVLSHVALPGMAIAITLNINPFIGAFAALFLAVSGIFYVEKRFSFSIETLVVGADASDRETCLRGVFFPLSAKRLLFLKRVLISAIVSEKGTKNQESGKNTLRWS